MTKENKKKLIKVAKELDKLGICPICILEETLKECEALMWESETEKLIAKLYEAYGNSSSFTIY